MTALGERYLRLLGVEDRSAGLPGLRALVQAHLARVPFENVSKLLLYAREKAAHVTRLDEFLDGIEFADLGGTCYTSNPFLAGLLRELGYDAELLGADMSRPDVHACIRVRIDGIAYHVDVGFAAPFREPLPWDALPARVDEGENHYLFESEGRGVRVSMNSRGTYEVGYFAHEPPRAREFFDAAVRASYQPDSTFLQCLRISRVWPAYSLDLMDARLYRHEAGRTHVTRLTKMAQLKAAVRDELQMPRCPIEAAVEILEGLTGKPFLGGDGAL